MARTIEERREYARQYYRKNIEKLRIYYRDLSKRRRMADPVGYSAYQKSWVEENRDRVNKSHRERRLIKPDKRYKQDQAKRNAYYRANKERWREAYRKWSEKNPGKERMRANLRRKSVIKATPKWADFEKMEEIYAQARLISKRTGIPHDVDHIYPLKGKTVCGLHWEGNLQILTETENCKKRNTWV